MSVLKTATGTVTGLSSDYNGRYSRRLTRYESTVREGARYELWATPENPRAGYTIFYWDRGVRAGRHPLEGFTERQARDEFERRVEQHYDTFYSA